MSMNLFFRGFTQQAIEDMAKNHALIDEWVEDERYLLETDVETAWDVLDAVLDGAGINPPALSISNALYNGCDLVSAEDVKRQAEILARWTHEQILDRLRRLDNNEDRYRLALYREEEEDLLEQFDAMAAFYKEAAEKGLGAVLYAA